jgi:hypothetical protein
VENGDGKVLLLSMTIVIIVSCADIQWFRIQWPVRFAEIQLRFLAGDYPSGGKLFLLSRCGYSFFSSPHDLLTFTTDLSK